jgi:hypothetical protein
MRWKGGRHHHDPRQIDLLAVFALLIAIIAAYGVFANYSAPPANKTALIEPSQHVRW